MYKIDCAPTDLVFGASSQKVIDIFDLHDRVSKRLALEFKHLDLDRIEARAQGLDGFFGTNRQHRYWRVLRRMRPGDMIFGKPEWAIALNYLAVRPNEPWDIEGWYTYEDRKGKTSRSNSQAKYRLDTISLVENEGNEGCLEPEFSALGYRLREFEEIMETLPNWIASGYAMQIRCRKFACGFGQRKAPILSRDEIARLAERAPDLDILREKLRCKLCGQNRPSLLLSNEIS